AGRQPDCENIAADRDIVKNLVEELKLQVRMLRIHRNLEEPLSVRISRSRFRSRLQKRVVNAASGKLSITRRIKAGRNTAKRFIDPGRHALRTAALEPILENMGDLRLRKGVRMLWIAKSQQNLAIPDGVDVNLAGNALADRRRRHGEVFIMTQDEFRFEDRLVG